MMINLRRGHKRIEHRRRRRAARDLVGLAYPTSWCTASTGESAVDCIRRDWSTASRINKKDLPMRKPMAVLTVFVARLCTTPPDAGSCAHSDAGPSWKNYVDAGGGGSFGGGGPRGPRSFRTASASSSFGNFRAFFLNTSASTCGIGFEIPVIPVLVIVTNSEGLGALLDGLLGNLGDKLPDRLTCDGNPITGPPDGGGPPGGGPPGGGGSPGGGGVAAVPEPATLAVWGLLGLASTGAGYRRLRRKST